jgi:hypothetical protein
MTVPSLSVGTTGRDASSRGDASHEALNPAAMPDKLFASELGFGLPTDLATTYLLGV